jgi:hypothetical protein
MPEFRPSSYGSTSSSDAQEPPIGPEEMYLVTDTSESGEGLGRVGSGPFHKKRWFWPTVAFGVALGVVGSLREK